MASVTSAFSSVRMHVRVGWLAIEELEETGPSVNRYRTFHTPKYIQKVTRKEWLVLCSVKNLGPCGSKGKVFKIQRN